MKRLSVSLSPHIVTSDSLPKVMWTVVAALVPAALIGIVNFGWSAFLVLACAVLFCVLTEIVCTLLLKQPVRVSDGSAVITGLLLGMNLPAGIPIWQLALGSVFAIGIGKMVFGGLGHNPFNPALVGRAFMLASFPVEMTAWPKPGAVSDVVLQFADSEALALERGSDALSSPTFLSEVSGAAASGGLPAPEVAQWKLDLLVGWTGGSLGEISALAILAGGIFLLVRKVITWESPVFYLGGLALFTLIAWLVDPVRYADPLFHILAGGAMLAAWFMVTDMVTSPMTVPGRIIFAGIAGLLTGAIRIFGAYPEGASYAILIMNAFVPLIDKAIRPRPFGEEASDG